MSFRDKLRTLLIEAGWVVDTDPQFPGDDRLHPPGKPNYSYGLFDAPKEQIKTEEAARLAAKE